MHETKHPDARRGTRRRGLAWRAVLVGGALLATTWAAGAATVRVAVESDSPRVSYGLERLERALVREGDRLVRVSMKSQAVVPLTILLGREQANVAGLPQALDDLNGPEDFRLLRRPGTGRGGLVVAALGDRGAMYGLMEVAERCAGRESLDRIEPRVVKARVGFRALKFNLPWMSYRKGPALQVHAETCRDLKFWKAFLDMMAENRFNALTLWNLHPFPYLIRPRNFPEACPFDDAELAEWQRFWHGLFRMARDRGIAPYLVNWNIFVSPAFSRAHDVANYSRDWKFFSQGDTSELVERYTRECVTQVINEYPELEGLGITLGEGMGGMTPEERRDWLERTFIAGMKAADRPVRFIHRAPLSAGTGSGGSVSRSVEALTREALERMDLPEPILVPFKYNWSHGHSSPRLHIVHGGPLTDTYWNPLPDNYRVVWTVRNEDFFVLRWGEPAFVREFLHNNLRPYVGGVIVGSECYIPAKDYLHQDGPHRTWRYAFERQWLFYRVWGRLLFDPATSDDVFARELGRRYGRERGQVLLEAWQTAGRIPRTFATFYRGTWDGTLYTEGFLTARQPGGAGQFIDVDTLIARPTLDPQYVNIADYVQADGRVETGRITPPAVAKQLDDDADRVFALVAKARTGEVSPTLACELTDLVSWAWWGRYAAAKIRGGLALETFRKRGAAEAKKTAVRELQAALCAWRKLADAIASHNRPTIPYIFDAEFSWLKHLRDAQADVETALSAKHRPADGSQPAGRAD